MSWIKSHVRASTAAARGAAPASPLAREIAALVPIQRTPHAIASAGQVVIRSARHPSTGLDPDRHELAGERTEGDCAESALQSATILSNGYAAAASTGPGPGSGVGVAVAK